VVCVWLFVSNLLWSALWSADYTYFVALPFGPQLVPVLSNALNVIVLQKLLGWVDCSYRGQSRATLDLFFNVTLDGAVVTSNEEVVCWEGFHRYYGVLALFLLVVYSLSTSILGVYFLEDPTPGVDVRWREECMMLDQLLRFIVVIVATLWTNTPHAAELVNVIAFGILAYVSLVTPSGQCDCGEPGCVVGLQVCSVNFLRVLVGASNTLCCWFSVIGLIASFLPYFDVDPQDRWEPFIVLVVGSVAISVGFVVMSLRESIQCCESKRHGVGDELSHVVLINQGQDPAAKEHDAKRATVQKEGIELEGHNTPGASLPLNATADTVVLPGMTNPSWDRL
jgi:hypothetical protein